MKRRDLGLLIVDFRLMIVAEIIRAYLTPHNKLTLWIKSIQNLKSKIQNLKSISLSQPLLKISCPLSTYNDFFIRFRLDGYFKFSIEPGMNFINAN